MYCLSLIACRVEHLSDTENLARQIQDFNV
jgi:hypothetical protein